MGGLSFCFGSCWVVAIHNNFLDSAFWALFFVWVCLAFVVLVVEVVAIRCIATGVGVFCVAKGGFAGTQGVKVLSQSFSQY